MKTKRMILLILLICLAGFAGLFFAMKSKNTSPVKVTEGKLDEMFRGDHTGQEKKELAKLFMEKIQETQLACALEDPTEHQEAFFEKICKGLEKINFEVSEVSRSGKTAEVQIQIDHFDLEKIVQNAQKTLAAALKEDASLSKSPDKMVEKLYEIIAEEFQKGPSEESKAEVTIQLQKNGHNWKVESSFEDEVIRAILQP